MTWVVIVAACLLAACFALACARLASRDRLDPKARRKMTPPWNWTAIASTRSVVPWSARLSSGRFVSSMRIIERNWRFAMLLLPLAGSAEETPDVSVFQCDASEVEIVTVAEPGKGLGIWLPPPLDDGYRLLPTIGFEPGLARFADDTWRAVLTEGTLELKGPEQLGPCRYDHHRSIWEGAKLRGVSFRAVGQEPGWLLEIRNGERIDFSFDYGQRTLRVPATEPDDDTSTRTSRFVSWPLEITIEGRPCGDAMSGEAFDTTVVVRLAERTFQGCGRPLH
ncbi:MAG: hypothetical protein AAGE01_15760 [Pseudomonadota bacterium]